MPTITIARDERGKINGVTDRDKRAYAKFRERLDSLGDGHLTFSWSEPRSGKHHRRFFAVMNGLFDAQEQFVSQDMFRKWIEVGSGHCDFCPGPTGKPVAIPKSIAYDKLDEVEFSAVEDAVMKFIRSEHALRFLYPHLSYTQGIDMIDAILSQFE